MSNKLVLALDVGGSSVKSALVEACRRLVDGVCVDTIQSKASAAEILNTLAMMITSHLQNCCSITLISGFFANSQEQIDLNFISRYNQTANDGEIRLIR